MIRFPYLMFFTFLAGLPILRLASGMRRQLVLAFFLTVLTLLFLEGSLIALGMAVGFSLFSERFPANSLRTLAAVGLIGAMIYFKLPSINTSPGNILPFLAFTPLGFSFQFFCLLGYWIDQKRRAPATVTGALPLYNSLLFFPSLVAGPYVSASYLLEKFSKEPGGTNRVTAAFSLITWGVLKKVLGDAFAVGVFSQLLVTDDQSMPAALTIDSCINNYSHSAKKFIGA